MINFRNSLTALLLVGLLSTACEKKEEAGLYSIYQLDKYKNPKPLINLGADWTKKTELMTGFPSTIEVYNSKKSINDRSSNLYLVVFNPKLIDLKPVLSSSAKTPEKFYNDETGTVYACINAGFFSGTTSLSLVTYNNVTSSANVKSLSRPLNGVNTTYYPTRAAFGLDAMYTPDVSWVYGVGTGVGVQYSYPNPSPNELNKAPQAAPSTTFPMGALAWNKKVAIGGSPMLVKDSIVNITDSEELIDVNNTSYRSRSAIGYLSNGNVVILAAEGDNAVNKGLTLKELANVMLELGCKGAVNLDGGGSTSLIVNGEKTVLPGNNNGIERAVISALLIKER